MYKFTAFIFALALCAQATAQPGPGVPSQEALATAPGLTPAQQADIRKTLGERRDALEALRDKTRGEMQAMHKRVRAERERINEANSDKLRKLLGEEGYQHYAAWQAEHHRGHRPMRGPMRRGMRGGHPNAEANPSAMPDAPAADFAALPSDEDGFDDGGRPGDDSER